MTLSFSCRTLLVAVLLTASACGGGTTSEVDAGTDAMVASDASGEDASAEDASPSDASIDDASIDAMVTSDAASDASVVGDGGCAPITNDSSAIGDDCDGTGCPIGYICQGFSGIVFQQSCQILCTDDCECPSGHSCEEMSDKAGTWTQCNPL